jgi:hypothetical protein
MVTTNKYNAIANLHNLQISTAHVKPSQSAFTSRFPVTDLKNGDSSTSVLTSLLSGERPTAALLLHLTNSHAGGQLTTPTLLFTDWLATDYF